MHAFSFIRFRAHKKSGSALLIVLCFVVLIAGLMVVFLSRASTELQVSNASANGTKSELLADTALDIIVDDLKQEIISNSTTDGTGTNTIYIPKTATYAVPLRQSLVSTASPALPNLIRISSHTDAQTRAANAVSTAASGNGRSVNLSRWNLHYLLPLASSGTVGDSTPVSSFTAPDWVIVTRSGPVAGATWSPTLADASTANTNYAIGRYAYAVYDEGGLLDVNAAGFPSVLTADQYGPKGGLAYADLTQLTDSSGNALLTQTQIDQIVGWRNYATTQPTGTFPNFAFTSLSGTSYSNQVGTSTNSFLQVASSTTYNGNTDHAVMGRQQLIKLLQGIGTTTTEQAQLQNALQYLGTFTREIDGPTCSSTGTSTTDYNPPHIFSVKVSGTFTRSDGTTAVIGEPLVKNRFPLEKLALLEKMQGVSTLTNQDIDDIARYFGLDPVSDSNGYYRHWSYPTTSTSYVHNDPNGIMSLSQVAAVNREPDFFELLQAGIYQGSLGKGGVRGDVLVGNRGYAATGKSAFIDPDSKVTLQLLRIGANIIDQWDADNYPTTITFTTTGDSVYGIEDLPYLNQFHISASGPASYTTYTQPIVFTISFDLWNPNQYLASDTGTYPTKFQISPLEAPGNLNNSDNYVFDIRATYSGTTTSTGTVIPALSFQWNWSTSWNTDNTSRVHFADSASNSSLGVIPFTVTNPTTNYREPTLSGTLSINPIVGYPDDTLYATSTAQASAGVTENWTLALANCNSYWLDVYTSTVYRIQFQDQSGVYRTYGTFVGLDNTNSLAPGTGFRQRPGIPLVNAAKPWWASAPKSDPRTFRFASGNATLTTHTGQGLLPSAANWYGPIGLQDPFSPSNATFHMDMWSVNDPADSTVFSTGTADPAKTNYLKPYYYDPDGKARPGDAVYSYSATPSISPLYDSTHGGPPARPIILNRPFHSVAELGYVFRDMPWKTLDFFSKYSADAALLDLFSLHASKPPVLAGCLDPNTRQANVLAAVIAGTTQASGSPKTNVASTAAKTIANAMVTLSQATPFTNRGDLVTTLMADTSISNISNIKTERESVVRALADCSNTRTWNLLIDLVAQVGTYPSSASSLNDFAVQGERHYWLHVAIDRYTGQIVDKQLEVVHE